MKRRIPALRVVSAVVSALGMVGLVALWPIGPAKADVPIDQITGNGTTNSVVTVNWAQGLVGPDNKTVVTPRDPNSPYAFMYQDFKDLSVTVSQTRNLVHQSIKVTWTGGKATQQPFATDFLQMMQCYGDAATGPDPEQCEYGSAGLMPAAAVNGSVGQRSGVLCDSKQPSTTNPPGVQGGGAPGLGCDPAEPSNPSHAACDFCHNGVYSVPFIPVGTTTPIYGSVTDYYDQFNTNEMQQVNTNTDGTGQAFFQTLTAIQSPGLGCGQLKSDGTARDCWLVIVPRGEYEPNGWKTNGGSALPGYINEPPVGASSWAQRIQVRLGFDPLQPNCPIGSAKERGTIGTELVARAVYSWQLALNTAANCRVLYGYAATPEATNTAQMADPSGTGLAFTTIPIGSETVRSGGNAGNVPTLVYAPVAVSAITFGFNINLDSGFISTPVKLTPRLLAKTLTQSYRFDLPDVDSNHPGPDWAKGNPDFMTRDPEFQKLNPDIPTPASGAPLAPLMTEDHSGINQQVWAWIQSDAAARDWLAGTPDENGMVVNPNYKTLNLGQAPPIDGYPRADPTCFNTGAPGERDPGRCSIDLIPYVNNFDDASSRTRAGNSPEGASWDPLKIAPDGQTGWWGSGGVEPAGRVFVWAAMDTASLASYGLVPADLCDATGANCVSPSAASVASALGGAKADSSGLLQVDSAKPGSGGYPLVQVSYAAVRVDQDAAALKDFAALIDYAANQGQTPGVDPGQLPHGYLPLPENLRTAAHNAATRLANGASPTPTTAATTPAQSNGNGITAGGVSGGVTAPPVAGPSPSTLAYTTTQASAAAATKTTSPTPVGAVRWALIAVVVAGLAGAIGGPLLRLGFGGRDTRLP